MRDIKNYLESVKERLAKATPGPWYRASIFKKYWEEKFNEVARVRGVLIHGPYASVSCGDEAEFIQKSPTDIDKFVRIVEAYENAIKMTIARADDYGDSFITSPIRNVREEVTVIVGEE